MVQIKTVMFIANRGFALTNSRELLIKHFIELGWRVVIATTEDSYAARLQQIGANVKKLHVKRGGLSPVKDFRTLLQLIRLYRKYKPDLVHHFHAKPIIYGNLALLFNKKPVVVNTLTGLGNSFEQRGFLNKLTRIAYKRCLSLSDKTIFQNTDDRDLFLENGLIEEEKSELIISSGVNLKKYKRVDFEKDNSAINVLMVARLLWSKGIKEYIDAANEIVKRHPSVNIQLAGEFDPSHPDGVDEEYIKKETDKGNISFLGFINVPETLQETDIFVLPSCYREGVPRVILEAAASSVPVITTDSPGCKEAVIPDESGFLVPIKDSASIVNSLEKLLHSEKLRNEMGEAGRRYVEEHFDIKVITEKYLNLYRSLGVIEEGGSMS
ncbi:glycosyltransferase family 4 protein [Salibacterium sp. K-3]